MSLWYPSAGSWEKYLQKKSLMRDTHNVIKEVGNLVARENADNMRQLDARISEQTFSIVANREELTKEFGRGFNSVNNTLEWGFGRVVDSLDGIEATIDSLHADFNYGIGLLIKQMAWTGEKVAGLLKVVDEIRGILRSPKLTEAREFYIRGNNCFERGLLSEAIEFLKEAEKIDKTDFFTHFLLGTIYLYGANENETVIDLGKAQHHMLLAGRYATAEIKHQPEFAKYASESLFHASIAVYATLGNEGVKKDGDEYRAKLVEARKLAQEAVRIHPAENFLESQYHVAKFSALLGEEREALLNLKTVMRSDKSYAVKVEVDQAFDSIKGSVETLIANYHATLKDLHEKLMLVLAEILEMFEQMEFNSLDQFRSVLSDLNQTIVLSKKYAKVNTIFGYSDSVRVLCDGLKNSYGLFVKRFEEKREKTQDLIRSIRNEKPKGITYLKKGGQELREVEETLNRVEFFLRQTNPNPEGFQLFANAFSQAGLSHFVIIGKTNQMASKKETFSLDDFFRSQPQPQSTNATDFPSLSINIGLLKNLLQSIINIWYLPHKEAFEKVLQAAKTTIRLIEESKNNVNKANQIWRELREIKDLIPKERKFPKSSNTFKESEEEISKAEELLNIDSEEALLTAEGLILQAKKNYKMGCSLLYREDDISKFKKDIFPTLIIGLTFLGFFISWAIADKNKATVALIGGIIGAFLGSVFSLISISIMSYFKFRDKGL